MRVSVGQPSLFDCVWGIAVRRKKKKWDVDVNNIYLYTFIINYISSISKKIMLWEREREREKERKKERENTKYNSPYNDVANTAPKQMNSQVFIILSWKVKKSNVTVF